MKLFLRTHQNKCYTTMWWLISFLFKTDWLKMSCLVRVISSFEMLRFLSHIILYKTNKCTCIKIETLVFLIMTSKTRTVALNDYNYWKHYINALKQLSIAAGRSVRESERKPLFFSLVAGSVCGCREQQQSMAKI